MSSSVIYIHFDIQCQDRYLSVAQFQFITPVPQYKWLGSIFLMWSSVVLSEVSTRIPASCSLDVFSGLLSPKLVAHLLDMRVWGAMSVICTDPCINQGMVDATCWEEVQNCYSDV